MACFQMYAGNRQRKFACVSDHSAEEMSVQSEATNPFSAMVLMAYDKQYLYISATCPRHPDLPADLPAHGTRKYDDNLAGFDRLQFSLDINRDYHSHYQFEIDQRGLTRDFCAGDINWDPKWYVACEGEKSHWRVEIAIPLKELLGKANLKPGDAWAVSLSRILPGIEVQSWGIQKKRTTRSCFAGDYSVQIAEANIMGKRFIIGMDEAGYGPKLGPLVICCNCVVCAC